MIRSHARWLLLIWATGAGAAEEVSQWPETIDQRIAACQKTEDANAERAIALAESVLAEGAALSPLQRAEALGCRGWSLAMQGRTDDARRDAHALKELVSKFAANAERVRLTRRAGGVLHASGDRIGAIDFYGAAVADAATQGLEVERIPLLVNLGVLNSEVEEHERARVNYEQALALMERLDEHRYEAPVRFNFGMDLIGQERYAEAIPHMRKAIELIQQQAMGGPMQELAAATALARALHENGESAEASALVAQVRAMPGAADDTTTQMQLSMIDAAQLSAAGDASGALAALEQIDQDQVHEAHRWRVLERRATLLEELGRYKQAIQQLRLAHAVRESHLSHRSHERVASLEAHMRDREQRLELEQLQAKSDAQARRTYARERLYWATAMIAGLMLLLGTTVVHWQRRMNQRLYLASHTDVLTGLANRRETRKQLRVLSTITEGQSAVLLIDIDLFKQINDKHGHDVGDQVLIAYAKRLSEAEAEGISAARWGGEEFLLTIADCSEEQAVAIAQRLLMQLAQPISTAAGQLQVSASLGYANLPLPGSPNPEAWHYSLQLADSALYLAKRSGRNAWAGYWIDQPIPQWPAERLGRESELARSLKLIAPRSSGSLREAIALATRNRGR